MSDGTLDRRTLLTGTAAVLGAAALSRVAGADEKEVRRPSIKTAVKMGMVRIKGSVEQKFRLVKDAGFDGIEMHSHAKLDVDEVLKARDKVGLPIHGVVNSVHWGKPLSAAAEETRAAGRKGLETALRECKQFGGSTVLLVPAVVNRKTPYDKAWERSTKEIRAVLPLAKELGIKIAIENVWNHFLLSPMEAAIYVDQFESPWIGWYFDVGNIWNYGWPEQWIRILGKRILKLDIKDYSRKQRNEKGLWNGFRVKIGETDLDWGTVREALAEIGFEGWATAEVAGGDGTRLAEISGRMNNVLGLKR